MAENNPKSQENGVDEEAVHHRRRRFTFGLIFVFLGAWFIATMRFFFPRTLFEPKTTRFWVAPELDNLLVKVEQQRKDDPVIGLALKRAPE